MSIEHAKRFFRNALNDEDLRDKVTAAADEAGRFAALKEAGYDFTLEEANDAFVILKRECQYEVQAEALTDLFQWWQFLHTFG